MVVRRVVRLALDKTGWDQPKLAAHLDVSLSTVSRMVAGRAGKVDAQRLAEIYRLAEASFDTDFGLSMESPDSKKLDLILNHLEYFRLTNTLVRLPDSPAWQPGGEQFEALRALLITGAEKISSANDEPKKHARRRA
jgi:transcriptional regulator with XRE-family HTH domain